MMMLPTIVRAAEWSETESRIRLIPQYADVDSVRIQMQSVLPSELRPICLFARTYRLAGVELLLTAYQ